MTLRIAPSEYESLCERSLFISASIPDPDRWDGEYDAFEITDAVVSLAREFLTNGWRLVTAAHPTIAPLLLYVASELSLETDRRILVYQSELFERILPSATRRFEADGIGSLIWTEAVDGDEPNPEGWHRSLLVMRHRMLSEAKPDAAVFIGGMDGIYDEHALFGELQPGRPRYALGNPGGAARSIAADQPASVLTSRLLNGDIYPAVWRAVLDDLRGEGPLDQMR